MKKRGLSEIVSTVLIILLVIAAIVIVWTFIRPLLTPPVTDVSGCLDMDLEVTACSISVAGADTVTVRRNRGEPTALKIVVDDGEDSQTTDITTDIVGLFATKGYTPDLTNLVYDVGNTDVSARVAGVSGERTCDASPEVSCTVVA